MTSIRMDGWMEQLASQIFQAPINQLAIPGTHDSVTYEITNRSAFSPDFTPPPALQKAMKIAQGPVRGLFAKWSRCQQVDVTTQLNGGVRYLDLRVCKFTDGNFYFCHGMIGSEVGKVLNEIKAWVTAHPKEIIILDFNHFYAMDEAAHHTLIGMLHNAFGSSLVEKTYAPVMTVGELWQQQKSVVLIYQHHCIPDHIIPLVWTQYNIESKWHNKQRPVELFPALQAEVDRMKALPQPKFWVFQGICTPNDKTCIKGVIKPWSKSKNLAMLANKVNVGLMPKLKSQWNSEMLNIVIIDMFHPQHEFAPTLVSCNATRPWAIQNPTPTPAAAPDQQQNFQ